MSGAEFSVGLAVVSINTAQHESLRATCTTLAVGQRRWGTINPPDAPGLVVAGSGWVLSVPRLFLCVGALHPNCRQCTSSVRVHRHVTGAVPPCLWRLSGLWGSSELGLSSGLGLSSAWGLCGASCCGSSEMSHVIPRHVFQTLKSHRWNCNVFGRCRKFGYPNCMRVLVDEAPPEGRWKSLRPATWERATPKRP